MCQYVMYKSLLLCVEEDRMDVDKPAAPGRATRSQGTASVQGVLTYLHTLLPKEEQQTLLHSNAATVHSRITTARSHAGCPARLAFAAAVPKVV